MTDIVNLLVSQMSVARSNKCCGLIPRALVIVLIALFELLVAIECMLQHSTLGQSLQSIVCICTSLLSLINFMVGMMSAATRNERVVEVLFVVYTISIIICFFGMVLSMNGNKKVFIHWFLVVLIKICLNVNILKFKEEISAIDFGSDFQDHLVEDISLYEIEDL